MKTHPTTLTIIALALAMASTAFPGEDVALRPCKPAEDVVVLKPLASFTADKANEWTFNAGENITFDAVFGFAPAGMSANVLRIAFGRKDPDNNAGNWFSMTKRFDPAAEGDTADGIRIVLGASPGGHWINLHAGNASYVLAPDTFEDGFQDRL
ncbi:MAG: hypothetical protein FJ387_23620 [Verrucomicrobia bacterium]|nr:hypothetical protein [Verrucomicrobiota bacterium]